MNILSSISLATILLILVSVSNLQVNALQCELYDDKECKENGKCGKESETCEETDPSSHCFVLWKDNNVRLKGCTQNSPCNDAKCIDHDNDPIEGVHFCCCSGDFCNREYYTAAVR